jgi:hypothetical protein
MKVFRWSLISILVLLAVNALAYGGFFFVSPADGLREFGYVQAGQAGEGAAVLVRILGVAMLGFAGFAVMAVFLLLRNSRSGLWVALILGVDYVFLGIAFAMHQIWTDALIYGGFGVLTWIAAGPLCWSRSPLRAESRD